MSTPKSKSIPIPNTEIKPISTTHPTPKLFYPYTEIKLSSIRHTEIKPISTTKPKPSQFRCSQ